MSVGAGVQRAGVHRCLPGRDRAQRGDGDQHGGLHQYYNADLDGQRRLRQQQHGGAGDHGDRHDGAGGDDAGGRGYDQSMRDGVELQRAGVRRQLQQRERGVQLRGQRFELPADQHGDVDGDRRVREQQQPQSNDYSGGHDGAGGDDARGRGHDQSMRDGVELQRAGVRRQLQQRERGVELRGQRFELPADQHGDVDGDRRVRQQQQTQSNDYSGGHDGADGDDAGGSGHDQSMRDGVELQRAGV